MYDLQSLSAQLQYFGGVRHVSAEVAKGPQMTQPLGKHPVSNVDGLAQTRIKRFVGAYVGQKHMLFVTARNC